MKFNDVSRFKGVLRCRPLYNLVLISTLLQLYNKQLNLSVVNYNLGGTGKTVYLP